MYLFYFDDNPINIAIFIGAHTQRNVLYGTQLKFCHNCIGFFQHFFLLQTLRSLNAKNTV